MIKPTGQTVTMDEIAARAGFSRGAVSLALRRSPKISEKTTEQILSVAQELGYRPNLNASRLARADFSTFGVVVSDLRNPIIAEIIDSFFLSAATNDFETYLGSGFNNLERERVAIESFLSHRVKGIVLVGSMLAEKEILELSRSVPTVLVGRMVKGIDCVLVDDEAGARLVAKHLLFLGHHKIAHIDGGIGAGAPSRRKAFIKEVRSSAGNDVAVVPGDYSQESGYRGASVLFSRSAVPTAIFAANDLMALGVLGAARTLGLSVGEDFALAGFDDMSLSAYDFVSLTSVTYSRRDMGQIARGLLQDRCMDPARPSRTVELTPSLVVRKSSGAPR